MGSVDEERSLLEAELDRAENSGLYTGDGSVDFNGNPVLKQNTGNWKACPFILGNECCERLAYYGIATNLVSYLTKKLHEGNASAARNVTTWQGTCYVTPLIGAVLADAYWGRYWTIAAFSTIYFIFQTTAPKSCFMRPPGAILAPDESIIVTVFKFVEPPENNEKQMDQKSRVKFKIMSLQLTGRSDETIAMIESYLRTNKMFVDYNEP